MSTRPMSPRSFATNGIVTNVILVACVGAAIASPVANADDSASQSTGRWAKSVVRTWVVKKFGSDSRRTRFGLDLDDGWQRTPVDRGLVILIHGYQSKPERHDSILKQVRAAGIPCGVLRYPNDQAIGDSAKLLASELKRIRETQPERQVTLLALSMGGLVSRAAIEDDRLDPGNVRRLLMIGTPNHGSRMAQLAVGADIWEFVVKSPEGSVGKRLFASVEDGLGEAASDLAPGSVFLKSLNRRQRNAKVEYALFLGTGAPVAATSHTRWSDRLRNIGERSSLTSWLVRPSQKFVDDLDEVVEGRGDGVVAVKRGRLAGVEDTVLFDFAHHHFMDGDREGSRKLRTELLARLTGKRPGR